MNNEIQSNHEWLLILQITATNHFSLFLATLQDSMWLRQFFDILVSWLQRFIFVCFSSVFFLIERHTNFIEYSLSKYIIMLISAAFINCVIIRKNTFSFWTPASPRLSLVRLYFMSNALIQRNLNIKTAYFPLHYT